MGSESALDEVGQQRLPLIQLEFEGASHHRPRGCEEKEWRGQTEEKQSTLAAGARIVTVAESGRKLFEGGPQGRRQRLHRHRATVGQVPEEEASGGIVRLHAIEDPEECVKHAERPLFSWVVTVAGPHVGETGGRIPQDRTVELPFAAEVI